MSRDNGLLPATGTMADVTEMSTEATHCFSTCPQLNFYDRFDREALWSVLQIYGIGGRLMRAVKSFYEGSRACVRVGRGESD